MFYEIALVFSSFVLLDCFNARNHVYGTTRETGTAFIFDAAGAVGLA
jgi:hypothetical protein